MVFGVVLAVVLGEIAIHLPWIAVNIHGDTLIIVILAACCGLYSVRHFSRLAYGILEMMIGLQVIVGTMSRKPELVEPGLLMVQLAAGMYVIIRGFDNAGVAAWFRALWDFLRRKKPNNDPSLPLQ